MSYQLSRLDLVVNNATTQITVNTNPSTQAYINGDITPQDNVINTSTTVNRFSAPDDYPAATVKSTSKAASLTDLTATEIGTVNVPISATVDGNGLKNLITSYYEGITYTPQLLTCVGVDSTSTTIQDLSSNNFTITNNNAATASSFAPFPSSLAYSSVLFDGTSQSLTNTVTAGSSLDLADGNGNWTIECWFNMSTITGTRTLFCKGGSTGTVNPSYAFTITEGSGTAVVGNTGAGILAPLPTTVLANTWYHYALVRSGNIVTSYLNGIAGTPAVMTLAMSNTANNLFGIGRAADGSTNFFPGYISNFRVVKGKALYLGNFTPTLGNFSAASVTTITTKVSATTTAYTKLTYLPLNIKLYNNLKYTAPTGQIEVYDSALTVNSYTTAATANINVISSQATMNVADRPDFYITGSDAPIVLSTEGRGNNTAAGSLSFNGTSQYLNTVSNAAFTFGTGDLTLECWIYQTATSTGAYKVIFADNVYGGVGGYTLYSYNNALNLWKGGSPQVEIIAPAGIISLNTWIHISWSRSGSSNRLFINGIQVGATTSDSTNYTGTSSYIGASALSTLFFPGYITNVRIVKGTAMYTANFTRTVPLTAVTNTQLLLLVNNDPNKTIDSSVNSFSVTNTGGVTYSSTIVPSVATTQTNSSPGAYVSTAKAPAFIRNKTKYNDPTQVEGYFNSFIPEHTGEEDRVQAWV